MVYSDETGVISKVSTISTTKSHAEAFVRRLIMQSIEDVLYQQGRSALLPNNVISSILQQLDVQINYDPLKCDIVVTEPFKMGGNGAMMNKLNCIIVDGTVTSTCMNANMDMCSMAANIGMNLKAIDTKYLTISGSSKTSNIIMANWSNQMWESVLHRALRSMTSSSTVGPHFYRASVRVA